jgi:hypothetical protein
MLGDVVNAALIVVMVALGMTLNAVQTQRSQRAAERLRQEVAPTATVLRDDAWIEVPRRDVVPGDVIRLVAGDHGALLPVSPLAGLLGFTPLPAGFLLFLATATLTYLAVVEAVKRTALRWALR